MIEDVIKRNNVTVHGEGTQVMLMAHGYGCNQDMWRFITPAFSSKYKIVLFDHVGSRKIRYFGLRLQKIRIFARLCR